jgi:hypothetical protein
VRVDGAVAEDAVSTAEHSVQHTAQTMATANAKQEDARVEDIARSKKRGSG